MFKFGERSTGRMQGVNPILIQCASVALAKSKHDMTIPKSGGLRSPDDQNILFKKGYSQKDGFDKKSYHQSGNALDVVPVVGGYANDRAFRHFAGKMFSAWQGIIAAGDHQGNTLEWGGHWQNFIDVPHFQIVKR